MKTLKVNRVVYGKSGTPLPDREYRLPGLSPVGTIMEIIECLPETSPVSRIECYNNNNT